MVPAYTLPPDAEDVKILRALVKETMSREQVDQLIRDVADALHDPGREGRRQPRRAEAGQDRQRLLTRGAAASGFDRRVRMDA